MIHGNESVRLWFNHFGVIQVEACNSTAKGTESVPIKMEKETEVPVVTKQAIHFIVPKGTDTSQLSFTTEVLAFLLLTRIIIIISLGGKKKY